MAGLKTFPNRPLVLLPLFESDESKSSSSVPLDRLQRKGKDKDVNGGARVAFQLEDDTGNSTDWISTTHIFPAAYPRSHVGSTSPPSEPIPSLDFRRAALEKGEERRAREEDFKTWERVTRLHPMETFFPPSSGREGEQQAKQMSMGELRQPQLWTAVQRLAPRRPVEGGITLFLSHANGFHKETYEPTMRSMLDTLSKQGKKVPPISEIWSMDSVDSGESGMLNRGNLGLAVSWFDQSRDMQQFIEYYMPVQDKETPGIVLKRNAKGKAKQERRVVGVGHSFNGAGMLMLNSLHSNCFDGIFIIDPVGVTPSDFPNLPVPVDMPLARGAIARKDVFTNRAAAREYMSSRAFFKAWDPRVLDLHLRYGLQSFPGQEEEEDPPVTLCQSKWREALAYSSYFLGTFSFEQTKKSTYKGWAHLICMSATDNIFFGERGSAPLLERFAHFSERSSSEILEGGHLVVLEQPDMLGYRLADVLSEYEKVKPDRGDSNL